MINFNKEINDCIKTVVNDNDRRIMTTGLKILELGEIISEDELDVLDEFFNALKEDYTLVISKDRKTLEFEILIKEQEIPVIENKHDVNALCNKLSKTDENLNHVQKSVLTFFNACEHIEENEILILDKIVDMLDGNWTLKPIEEQYVDGKVVKSSKFVSIFQKELVKTK